MGPSTARLLFALALAGCGDDGGAPADAMVDADRARTDLVPAVGTATTIAPTRCSRCGRRIATT